LFWDNALKKKLCRFGSIKIKVEIWVHIPRPVLFERHFICYYLSFCWGE